MLLDRTTSESASGLPAEPAGLLATRLLMLASAAPARVWLHIARDEARADALVALLQVLGRRARREQRRAPPRYSRFHPGIACPTIARRPRRP